MHCKKLALAVFAISSIASAQTCTTATCTAAGVTEAQFLAALPASGNTNPTVVVNIPSGSSTWTTGFSYTVPSAITSLTIQGATTVTFTGTAGLSSYSASATDNTSITDGITGSTPPMTFIVNGSSQFLRVTGLTITSAASNVNAKYGEFYFGGSTYDIRLDHCHFISPADTGSMGRWGGTVGVIDHNKVDLGSLANQNVMNAFQSDDTPDDNIGYGDGNFAKATPWGTNKMLYIEANYFTAGAPNDCAIGGMFVMRYNSVIDAYVSTQTHGTKSDAGAGRGCRAFEAYHNYYFATGANTPWDSVIGSKGTTALIWGNTMPSGGFYRFFVPSTDRNISPANVNESAGQPTEWGYCGTNINGTGSTWDGNQTTALGWPCLDSIGRGQDTQALNGASTIAARLNMVTGTQAWSHQLLEPVYLFMNTVSPASGVEVNPRDQTTTQDRDYYQECNSSMSDSSCATHSPVITSFNGTHGTGFGTHASRPATCTPGAGTGSGFTTSPTGSYGVAYFATDDNSGNGELWVCTSTNTWTGIYQPYTYPHPLIGGSSLIGTSISLSSSSTTPPAGTNITLTAAITPSSGPTGTVTFFDGGISIGTSTLPTLTFAVSAITAGTHVYTATYGGDGSYSTSTSSGITVVSTAIGSPQKMQGLIMTGVSLSNPLPPATSGLTFTPAAGTYTGTQNVAIAYTPGGSGTTIFYTTNGQAASEASALYTGPIAVPASSTINVLVESAGSVRQETQALPNSSWKLCTPLFSSTLGTPTSGNSSKCGGGVGSDQPSTWNITPGSTESMSISSIGGFPQWLYTIGGAGCDSCTKITEDKWVQPVSGSNMQNYEMDDYQYDGTRKILHMIGLQCNQQAGKLQWQYDNEQGSWQNTGVTAACPLPAGVYTHVIYEAHWIIGDTGCGGLGCTFYDALTINGTRFALNKTLENDNPNWASACGIQDQEDLPSGGTSAHPLTSGELIQHNNVTCSSGTIATGSAAYTIH